MKKENAIKLINEIKQFKKLLKNMEDHYIKTYTSKLTDECRDIISDWYSDIYEDGDSPHIYHRHRKSGLNSAYKILNNDGGISIEFNSGFIKQHYRVNTDYIFENSFIEGYHGGANKGKKHPAPGIPYWKQWGDFTSWGRPATRSDSPYESIMQAYDEIMDTAMNRFDNDFGKKIYDPLIELIKRLG